VAEGTRAAGLDVAARHADGGESCQPDGADPAALSSMPTTLARSSNGMPNRRAPPRHRAGMRLGRELAQRAGRAEGGLEPAVMIVS